MSTLLQLTRYALVSNARSRWIAGYALFFLCATEGLLRFGSDTSKAVVSLLNITLLIIPLVSIVIGTTTVYNNRDFTELLLSQPIPRQTLFAAQYFGLTLPLCLSYLLGTGFPLLTRAFSDAGHLSVTLMLLGSGAVLTLIFSGFALVLATRFDDKAFGLGAALLLWLAAAILYDGLLLAGIWIFREYPLELPVLAMSMLNPIDLARTLVMLQFDVAALMGYTGAVFEKFFGTTFGVISATTALLWWCVLPIILGMRLFAAKDF
jgi:Cu-processing system permease protein